MELIIGNFIQLFEFVGSRNNIKIQEDINADLQEYQNKILGTIIGEKIELNFKDKVKKVTLDDFL